MINMQSTLSIAPDFCKNVSLRCYLAATVVHTQSVRSQISAYIDIFFTIWRHWTGKTMGQQRMPSAKEALRSAILDTRAIGSTALPCTLTWLSLCCFCADHKADRSLSCDLISESQWSSCNNIWVANPPWSGFVVPTVSMALHLALTVLSDVTPCSLVCGYSTHVSEQSTDSIFRAYCYHCRRIY